MDKRELYRQKKQAQLDEWKADVQKLRARVSGRSADAQLKLKKEIAALEGKIDEGRKKLSEIADASEDAWESVEKEMESAWASLKSSVNDAVSRFRE